MAWQQRRVEAIWRVVRRDVSSQARAMTGKLDSRGGLGVLSGQIRREENGVAPSKSGLPRDVFFHAVFGSKAVRGGLLETTRAALPLKNSLSVSSSPAPSQVTQTVTVAKQMFESLAKEQKPIDQNVPTKEVTTPNAIKEQTKTQLAQPRNANEKDKKVDSITPVKPEATAQAKVDSFKPKSGVTTGVVAKPAVTTEAKLAVAEAKLAAAEAKLAAVASKAEEKAKSQEVRSNAIANSKKAIKKADREAADKVISSTLLPLPSTVSTRNSSRGGKLVKYLCKTPPPTTKCSTDITWTPRTEACQSMMNACSSKETFLLQSLDLANLIDVADNFDELMEDFTIMSGLFKIHKEMLNPVNRLHHHILRRIANLSDTIDVYAAYAAYLRVLQMSSQGRELLDAYLPRRPCETIDSVLSDKFGELVTDAFRLPHPTENEINRARNMFSIKGVRTLSSLASSFSLDSIAIPTTTQVRLDSEADRTITPPTWISKRALPSVSVVCKSNLDHRQRCFAMSMAIGVEGKLQTIVNLFSSDQRILDASIAAIDLLSIPELGLTYEHGTHVPVLQLRVVTRGNSSSMLATGIATYLRGLNLAKQ